MGLAGGLPVGLSFIGAKWADARIMAMAEAFAANAPSLSPPTFAARLDPEP